MILISKSRVARKAFGSPTRSDECNWPGVVLADADGDSDSQQCMC